MLNTNRKYLCKKSSICCVKGSYYKVHSSSLYLVLMIDINDNYDEIFSIYDDRYRFNYNKFDEHFYTEQELRKLKLERLANVI